MLADLEWRQGADPSLAPALSQHFKALLANGGTLRPVPLDAHAGRRRRAAASCRRRCRKMLYDGIKRTYADQPGQGLRLDQVAGLGADKVFKRRSGVPLSTPMPACTLARSSSRVTGDGRAELVKQLSKDAWVWGDSAVTSTANAGTLVSGVTNLYEQDYIRAWDALLDDMKFAAFGSIPQTNEALRDAGRPDVPAARPASRRRRQHDAGGCGLADGRERRHRSDAQEGHRHTQRRARSRCRARSGMAAVEPGMLGHGAFPMGAAADRRRGGQDASSMRSSSRLATSSSSSTRSDPTSPAAVRCRSCRARRSGC